MNARLIHSIALTCFATVCWSAEAQVATEIESAFLHLLDIDGQEYLELRNKLCDMPRAAEYAERVMATSPDWRQRAIAGACLAKLLQKQEFDLLFTHDPESMSCIYMWFSDKQAADAGAGMEQLNIKSFLKRAEEVGVQDDLLIHFLTERLFRTYRGNEWANIIESRRHHKDAQIRANAEVTALRMPLHIRILAVRCLGMIGTPEQTAPLVSVALSDANPFVRRVAVHALASMKNRDAKGKVYPSAKGEAGFALTGPPKHKWETYDVTFSDRQLRVIWQTLLVALQIDPSEKVRKAAAEGLGRNSRFVPAIPFLKTVIAEMPEGDVRKAAEKSLEFLEAAREREAEE